MAGKTEQKRYRLSLYVIGATPHSARAIVNLRRICEERAPGEYELNVVDVTHNPKAAKEHQVVATPTLVREAPLPVRRLVGDMSRDEVVAQRLGLPGRGEKPS